MFIVLALVALTARAQPTESESAGQADAQRAACAAKCREDYQSNATALQACLRDCGAIGPATAEAISPGHEASHAVQQAAGAAPVKASKGEASGGTPDPQATTVKSSKSHSDNRGAAPPPPTPAEESEDDAPAER